MNTLYILNASILSHELVLASVPEAKTVENVHFPDIAIINCREQKVECLFDHTMLPFQLLSDICCLPQRWVDYILVDDFSLF